MPVSGTYILGWIGRRCETWTPSGPSQNLPVRRLRASVLVDGVDVERLGIEARRRIRHDRAGVPATPSAGAAAVARERCAPASSDAGGSRLRSGRTGDRPHRQAVERELGHRLLVVDAEDAAAAEVLLLRAPRARRRPPSPSAIRARRAGPPLPSTRRRYCRRNRCRCCRDTRRCRASARSGRVARSCPSPCTPAASRACSWLRPRSRSSRRR